MQHTFKTLILSGMVFFTGCGGGNTTNNEDVLSSDKPKIKLEGSQNIKITLGTRTVSESGYSATDEVDGDLTKKIKRTHNIDFTKVGEYKITYTVEDTDGYKDTKYRYVSIVNPLSSSSSGNSNNSNNSTNNVQPYYNNGQNYQGSAPEIKLLRYEREFEGPLYLPLGGDYDIAYSATDFEDGNLGESVKTTGANFDPNKAGTYLVTYSVTDSNRNSVSKSLTVIVGSSATWNTSTTTALDSFIDWYSRECGQTFNNALYSKSTGRYNGTISCSSKNLSYVNLEPMSVFSSIKSIDLSHNNLSDIDFTPLANTHVIKKIDLSYNDFSNIDFSPLYNLQNIDELWINGNKLSYTRAEREALFRGFNNKSFTIYF